MGCSKSSRKGPTLDATKHPAPTLCPGWGRQDWRGSAAANRHARYPRPWSGGTRQPRDPPSTAIGSLGAVCARRLPELTGEAPCSRSLPDSGLHASVGCGAGIRRILAVAVGLCASSATADRAPSSPEPSAGSRSSRERDSSAASSVAVGCLRRGQLRHRSWLSSGRRASLDIARRKPSSRC